MAAVRTYPSDVADEEWACVTLYLALMREEVPQRKYPLRALFNALRYLTHTGCPWRYLPTTYRPGRQCTSNGADGGMPACSSLSCTT